MYININFNGKNTLDKTNEENKEELNGDTNGNNETDEENKVEKAHEEIKEQKSENKKVSFFGKFKKDSQQSSIENEEKEDPKGTYKTCINLN